MVVVLVVWRASNDDEWDQTLVAFHSQFNAVTVSGSQKIIARLFLAGSVDFVAPGLMEEVELDFALCSTNGTFCATNCTLFSASDSLSRQWFRPFRQRHANARQTCEEHSGNGKSRTHRSSS